MSDDSRPCKDGAPAPGHGGVLAIDLAALAANYRALAARAAPAETAAAIKGDGYGLGLQKVALALHAAGCRTFFVAHLGEAEALRRVLGPAEAVIYVLNGLLPGMAPALARIDARPVLGSLAEIDEWRGFAAAHRAPPAAIQIDTGFTRLGLGASDMAALGADRARLAGFETALAMSHLACADDPGHAMNEAQLARFREALGLFPGIRASLANSAGIALGPGYRFDMVRPGIALYGGRARISGANDMARVVSLEVPIVQVRVAEPGSSAGYGATYRFRRRSKVALVSLGYGDGFLRALGASGERPGGRLFVAGRPCPIVGRVSMDITAIDVTDCGAAGPARGDMAEVLGPNQSVDDLAAAAGTIGYEILTRLGLRHARVYSPPAPPPLPSGASPS
jgi:alanine racemase